MHPDSQLQDAVTKGFDPKLLYDPNLDHVDEPVRSILEEYSNIPADKILEHVRQLVSTSRARPDLFEFRLLTVIREIEHSPSYVPCYQSTVRSRSLFLVPLCLRRKVFLSPA